VWEGCEIVWWYTSVISCALSQRRQFFNDVHVLDLDLNAWLGQNQGLEENREGGVKTEGEVPEVLPLFILPTSFIPTEFAHADV
jgi:hypothetical protein